MCINLPVMLVKHVIFVHFHPQTCTSIRLVAASWMEQLYKYLKRKYKCSSYNSFNSWFNWYMKMCPSSNQLTLSLFWLIDNCTWYIRNLCIWHAQLIILISNGSLLHGNYTVHMVTAWSKYLCILHGSIINCSISNASLFLAASYNVTYPPVMLYATAYLGANSHSNVLDIFEYCSINRSAKFSFTNYLVSHLCLRHIKTSIENHKKEKYANSINTSCKYLLFSCLVLNSLILHLCLHLLMFTFYFAEYLLQIQNMQSQHRVKDLIKKNDS